jgi:hypothetical protein
LLPQPASFDTVIKVANIFTASNYFGTVLQFQVVENILSKLEPFETISDFQQLESFGTVNDSQII